MKDGKRIQVVIWPELYDQLAKRAKRRGTNVAAEFRALALAEAARQEEFEDALRDTGPYRGPGDGRRR